jgi:electron transfer flavoprotein alpha/beta subunit
VNELVVCVHPVWFEHDLELVDGVPVGIAATERAEECAVAMARSLAEQTKGEVTLLSVAPETADPVLDRYLSLGAHRLVRCWDPRWEGTETCSLPSVLAAALVKLKPRIVFCGDAATGGVGTGLVGPIVAELLGAAFGGRVVGIRSYEPESVIVERLLTRGDRQLLRVGCAGGQPALLAISPSAPAPPYPALTKLRRAVKEVWGPDELGLETAAVGPLSDGANWTRARPRARKLFTPPATASAAERLRMVMAGPGRAGAANGSSSGSRPGQVAGTPDEIAEQILRFLHDQGVTGTT